MNKPLWTKTLELPDEVIDELIDIMDDFISFCSMLKVLDKKTKQLIPFTPTPAQEQVIAALLSHNRILIPKARQLGVSTLMRAWYLYQAYKAEQPLSFAVLSHHERSAKHLRSMDKNFYTSLPEPLHRPLKTDSSTEMVFDDTGAGVSSYTASSPTTTRSFTLNAAHLSEFCFYNQPEEILAVVLASVGDGQVVIETTTKTPGDHFHKLVMGAPENGWHVVFLPWYLDDNYRSTVPNDFSLSEEEKELQNRYGLDKEQLQWRRERIGTTGISKFNLEYPTTLDDCFRIQECAYFDIDKIRKIKPVMFDTADKIYDQPNKNDIYVMGVDTSAGVGGDYSAISVVSATTRTPVYQWRSNTTTPTELAEKIIKVSNRYNNAKVLIESNNHGHAVLTRLSTLNFRNLWRDKNGKFWVTTAKSKLDAYENLREYIHEEMINKLDSVTLMELSSLTVERVTPEAPSGMHDDMADSLALAYRALRDIPSKQLSIMKGRNARNLIDRYKVKKKRSNGIQSMTKN